MFLGRSDARSSHSLTFWTHSEPSLLTTEEGRVGDGLTIVILFLLLNSGRLDGMSILSPEFNPGLRVLYYAFTGLKLSFSE